MINFELVAIAVAIVAVGATSIAIRKHLTLAVIKSAVKVEAASLEASAAKAEASVKAEVLAIVARLKAL